MKNTYSHLRLCFFIAVLISITGCNKENDFLNAKPSQALAIPSSLTDLQNLLDDENVFNKSADPVLGQISSDDFLVQDSAYPTLSLSLERSAYTWQKAIFDASYTQ